MRQRNVSYISKLIISSQCRNFYQASGWYAFSERLPLRYLFSRFLLAWMDFRDIWFEIRIFSRTPVVPLRSVDIHKVTPLSRFKLLECFLYIERRELCRPLITRTDISLSHSWTVTSYVTSSGTVPAAERDLRCQ